MIPAAPRSPGVLVTARVALVALIASVALTASGCSAPAPSAPAQTGTPAVAEPAETIRVTLGLYSGRADPSWVLEPDESLALDRALGALPRAVGRPPEGGLGYRGFTIERPAGTLIAYRGAVAPPGQGAREYLSDPTLIVERLLLEFAGSRIGAAELAEVRRSLGAP